MQPYFGTGVCRSEELALSLPQLAATLAATVTAHESMNAAGERLIGTEVINVVIVLMVLTKTIGQILAKQFGSKIARPPVVDHGWEGALTPLSLPKISAAFPGKANPGGEPLSIMTVVPRSMVMYNCTLLCLAGNERCRGDSYWPYK